MARIFGVTLQGGLLMCVVMDEVTFILPTLFNVFTATTTISGSATTAH